MRISIGWRTLGVCVLLAPGAVTLGGQSLAQEWRPFGGTWSAVGKIQTVPTETSRPAAIVQLSGSVVLNSYAGLSRGFRAEAIGFDDGSALSGGRAVWTDARGDRVYSVLTGEPVSTGRRIVGTFTGGTGQYAGAIGQYELTWQYVVATEDGEVQGRASDLKGRIRRGGP
jgi:hypothetical protein